MSNPVMVDAQVVKSSVCCAVKDGPWEIGDEHAVREEHHLVISLGGVNAVLTRIGRNVYVRYKEPGESRELVSNCKVPLELFEKALAVLDAQMALNAFVGDNPALVPELPAR